MACQVDKGEFRWEFLVPWVNRSLTTVDKVVVCTSFVVASFTLQKLFDPGASVGAPPHPTCRLQTVVCTVQSVCAVRSVCRAPSGSQCALCGLLHSEPPPPPA